MSRDREKIRKYEDVIPISEKSYYDEKFQNYIVAKTKIFAQNLESYLQNNLTISKMAGLSFVCSPFGQAINVVDLGGGAGIDFFIAKELFDSDLNWVCIETDIMCKVATGEHLHSNLKFISMETFLTQKSTHEFSLYSNSALQYLPQAIDLLSQLLLKRPLKVAIVRTPFVLQGEHLEQIQISELSKNGPQIQFFTSTRSSVHNAVTIMKLEELKEVLNRNGYEIICENIQDGSFTPKRRLLWSGESIIKTVDILAKRIE